MEVEEAQSQSGTLPATYPLWVMFPLFCKGDKARDAPADAKTLAASRTTTGCKIQASLHLAAPPAASCVCVQLVTPDGVEHKYSTVLAAHGDSVLIQVCLQERRTNGSTNELFVYNAGTATANPTRLPSLLLLPPCYITEGAQGPVPRYNQFGATGLLRRGMDEIVVAELTMVAVNKDTPDTKTAEIVILRSSEWSVKRPPIIGDLPSSWNSSTAMAVSDRLLCWVDLSIGLIFFDVVDQRSSLRYVPLPDEPRYSLCRNVCVTAGGGTLKFVNLFPRCCCGSAGATKCCHSRNAYTIRTWTLKTDDMVWVMDGMVDWTELQASFNCYKDLPRVRPVSPIVSPDDTHIICFILCNNINAGDGDLWLIMLDMKSKMLQSVSHYPGGLGQLHQLKLFPSRVSYYLNSYSNNGSRSSNDGEHKCHMDIELTPCVIVDKQLSDGASIACQSGKDNDEPTMTVAGNICTNGPGDLVPQYSCNTSVNHRHDVSQVASSQEEVIFAELQKIPGLPRDDMLKAYSILTLDNGRRFRSLLGLPMDLRKDWLLMEIKAS